MKIVKIYKNEFGIMYRIFGKWVWYERETHPYQDKWPSEGTVNFWKKEVQHQMKVGPKNVKVVRVALVEG